MKVILSKNLRVSRPRFWIYTFGPYIVGLLAGASRLEALLDTHILLFALYFLYPANLLIYGINDVHDNDTDQHNAKKSGYETALESSDGADLQRLIWIVNVPFLIATVLLTDLNATLALLGFWFFAYFYSAPPIRAKARPILDSAFNILYAFPAFFAYFLLGGSHIDFRIVLACWCWVMAMHAYSAVPDISADRAAGLRTIATTLGAHSTIALCALLYFTAALLSFPELSVTGLALGGVYVLMMLVSGLTNDNDRLLQIYARFPLLNTFCGAVLFFTIAKLKFL